ncbi:MAG: ABC transporter substrate-binding protein [Bradymonadales bacterium]|nr:ABC transporter substrate-binding protein [Bradymonadales bacterium]
MFPRLLTRLHSNRLSSSALLALVLFMAGIFSIAGCGDEESPDADTIVIGGIFHTEASATARLRLQGVQMAVEEINAAGVLPTIEVVNVSPAGADGNVTVELTQSAVQNLHDEHQAVGVVSLFSSIANTIIEVTQTAPYDTLVQCNCSATSPALNDLDQNHTFYRTVRDDNAQGELVLTLIEENEWERVALYWIDDSYGNGLSEVLRDGSEAFDRSFPTGEYDVTSNLSDLADLLDSTPDVIVVIGFDQQAGPIFDHVTTEGYSGAIVVTDGAVNSTFFTHTPGVAEWIASGNVLMGTSVDNQGEDHYDTFDSAFRARWGEAPNPFSSNAYDCTYLFALSLLKAAAGEDNLNSASVKQQMQSFQNSTGVEVGIGSNALIAARAAITAGSSVTFNGASGEIVFDADGERIIQNKLTWVPNATGDDWVRGTVYP